MSESLWVEMDAALKALVIAEMGAGSSVSSLKLTTVKSTILRDIGDWKDWGLPAAAIAGRLTEYKSTNEHPGPHYSKTMPYSIALIADGDQESAVERVKVLAKRLEAALLLAPVGSNHPSEIRENKKPSLERVEIMLFRKASSLPDQWYGVAFLDFQVVSRI